MSKLFVFIDVETTGTDPHKHDLLELAWAITDESFKLVGNPQPHVQSHVIKLPPHRWGDVVADLRDNDYVRSMHIKSGLWDQLPSAELDFEEVFNLLIKDINASTRTFTGEDSVHMAGFSVEFDWRFLEAQAYGDDNPKLEEWFHHRLLNLSAVKLLFDSQGVGYEQPVNPNQHRALSDVFEAIDQAKIFAKMVKGGLF